MKYRILIMLFTLCFACSKQEGLNKEIKGIVKKIVKDNIDLAKIKNVVVIPNEGCGGCINDATSFFVKNINKYKNNTVVIFTGVQDMKLLKIGVGEKFLTLRNVFIDKNNFFMNTKYSSSYPQIIKLNKKMVSSFSVFDKEIFVKSNN